MTEVTPIRSKQETTPLENGDELLFKLGNEEHTPEWIILAARQSKQEASEPITNIAKFNRPLSPAEQVSRDTLRLGQDLERNRLDLLNSHFGGEPAHIGLFREVKKAA